jgi:hypothetical protein
MERMISRSQLIGYLNSIKLTLTVAALEGVDDYVDISLVWKVLQRI